MQNCSYFDRPVDIMHDSILSYYSSICLSGKTSSYFIVSLGFSSHTQLITHIETSYCRCKFIHVYMLGIHGHWAVRVHWLATPSTVTETSLYNVISDNLWQSHLLPNVLQLWSCVLQPGFFSTKVCRGRDSNPTSHMRGEHSNSWATATVSYFLL